jgi:hypothetical protein
MDSLASVSLWGRSFSLAFLGLVVHLAMATRPYLRTGQALPLKQLPNFVCRIL